MSIIAAALLASAATAAPPRTVESILEAHRAKTSIGPDPCRSSDENEIVVCARRQDEFATGIDDTGFDDASAHGGNHVGQMQVIKDATSSCKSQGHGCRGSINVFAVGKFVVGGVRALLGKDD